MFEILLAHSYNIYLALHSTNHFSKLSNFQFKYSIVREMPCHDVARAAATTNSGEHRLVQWDPRVPEPAGVTVKSRGKTAAIVPSIVATINLVIKEGPHTIAIHAVYLFIQ